MADILVRTSEMFGQQAVYSLRRQWFCERGVRGHDRAHRGPHGWISNGALRWYLAKCGIGHHGAAPATSLLSTEVRSECSEAFRNSEFGNVFVNRSSRTALEAPGAAIDSRRPLPCTCMRSWQACWCCCEESGNVRSTSESALNAARSGWSELVRISRFGLESTAGQTRCFSA